MCIKSKREQPVSHSPFLILKIKNQTRNEKDKSGGVGATARFLRIDRNKCAIANQTFQNKETPRLTTVFSLKIKQLY